LSSAIEPTVVDINYLRIHNTVTNWLTDLRLR
jgi:hypothetical protein